jgi:hypothetical protein
MAGVALRACAGEVEVEKVVTGTADVDRARAERDQTRSITLR